MLDTAYLKDLDVQDGIIYTAGPYYLEPRCVPYFHAKCNARHSSYYERDPDGDLWVICKVSKEEKEAFPELSSIATVGIRSEGEYVVSWVRSCWYQKVWL